MTANNQLLSEVTALLKQCNAEKLMSITKINKILVGLSSAQLEYIFELSNLLFGQPPK